MVTIAEAVIRNAFHADSVPQMPFFPLLVKELVQLFMAHKTFVFFRSAANGDRRGFLPKNNKTKFKTAGQK